MRLWTVLVAMQTEMGFLTWAAAFEQKPKYVFVVHGNDESCESLTDALTTQLVLQQKHHIQVRNLT